MLSAEQVKKIAEYIGLEVVSEFDGKVFVPAMYAHSELFNPIKNDDWNHKVFKALADECEKKHIFIRIIGGGLELFSMDSTCAKTYFHVSEDFNNENICLAYLAVMDTKDEL